MKTTAVLLLLLIVFAAVPTLAPAEPVDPVRQWLADRAMRAAEKAALDDVEHGQTEGVYRLIPLAELDAPESVKQHFRDEIQRSRSGVVWVQRGTIPSQRVLLRMLPKEQRSDATLRQRLPNPPTTLRGTVLGAAEMIGMEPTGAMEGLNSSGLSRFYRVSEIGIVEFNEENFRVPGGVIEAFVEAQNTTVNATPAQIEMTADDEGHGRVVLVWAGKDKLYTLIATGDSDVERKSYVLREIAAWITD